MSDSRPFSEATKLPFVIDRSKSSNVWVDIFVVRGYTSRPTGDVPPARSSITKSTPDYLYRGRNKLVDPNCLGQGLRPAAISHEPVCSAIIRFTDPYVRARDCFFGNRPPRAALTG